jgi:hypothetical protein
MNYIVARGYNTRWTREEGAGPFVDIPDDDLMRLHRYYTDPEAAELLLSIVERSDELRVWRFVELGEQPTCQALRAMARSEGLTPALAEARELLPDG